MDDEDARQLIPTEKINRYLRGVVDALDALRAGQRESGREILRQGLQQALRYRVEPWRGPLVRMWVRALQSYEPEFGEQLSCGLHRRRPALPGLRSRPMCLASFGSSRHS